MCGRYAASNNPDDLQVEFEAVLADDSPVVPAHYNVAPTDPVYAIRTRKPKDEDQKPYRELSVVRWGLVPSWAKDTKIGSKMFNARVESLTDKPAFRTAFQRRRALIPADGWFEWKVTAGAGPRTVGKQPYFMTPADGSNLAFAGLWEIWGTKPDLLLTCTVITIPAVGTLTDIHDRMPFVMPRERWAQWLDPTISEPSALLEPTPLDLVRTLEIRPVGTEVGNVKNDGPGLLDRVDLGRADQDQAQQLTFDNPG